MLPDDGCKRFLINWFIENNGFIHLNSSKIQFEDTKKKNCQHVQLWQAISCELISALSYSY